MPSGLAAPVGAVAAQRASASAAARRSVWVTVPIVNWNWSPRVSVRLAIAASISSMSRPRACCAVGGGGEGVAEVLLVAGVCAFEALEAGELVGGAGVFEDERVAGGEGFDFGVAEGGVADVVDFAERRGGRG